MASDEQAGLLSVSAVARRLGVSPMTVRRLIHSGQLRAARIGCKLWRIDPADVERLAAPAPIEASSTATRSEPMRQAVPPAEAEWLTGPSVRIFERRPWEEAPTRHAVPSTAGRGRSARNKKAGSVSG